MLIDERVELYKSLFPECKAFSPVRQVIVANGYRNKTEREQLELIRELDTKLAEAYKVTIPVITFYVRDNNYVPQTKEIFLSYPDLEGFLHQFRHHLQNEARATDQRLLLVEGRKGTDTRIPFRDTIYTMMGEDDSLAWSRMIIESV